MRKFTLILIILAFALSGCTKKAKTTSTPSGGGRVVTSTGNEQVFVTHRPGETTPELPEITVPEPVVVEIISPINFPEKETEHVRIVDYNPFGNASELSIDLEELARFFCYPYPGNKISDYGMRGRAMHTGVDIKTLPNDTVRAALSGVVRMSKTYSAYGNIVVIRHPCGLETAYAHNAKNLVKPNDIVRAGDPIALAGRTGRATTEHIHFETRIMGEHFDPNLLIDTQNRTLQSGKLYLNRRNGRITASNSQAVSSAAPALASNTPRLAANIPDIHTVQRGDTLYSISRRYGMSIDQLCSINGISRDGILSIGQKLKLK